MNLKKYKSIAELFAIHAVHIYVSQNAIGTIRMVLFVCLFVLSRLSNFSAIQRLSPLPVTARAANLGLCSALRAFEQGGIFIVPHLL